MARQDRVLRQSELGHGGVADPLLRHKGRAERAPFVDAERRDVLPEHLDAARAVARLARNDLEQFVLPIAGHAGDADDLAAPNGQ